MATIQGTSGDDIIDKDFVDEFGGSLTSGKDKIWGGEGTDDGADTFVFTKNSGNDTVMDFNVDEDVIQIAKGLNGIKKAKDVLEHATEKNGDVVIDLGKGNSITLKDVKLKELKKNPGDHFDIV